MAAIVKSLLIRTYCCPMPLISTSWNKWSTGLKTFATATSVSKEATWMEPEGKNFIVQWAILSSVSRYIVKPSSIFYCESFLHFCYFNFFVTKVGNDYVYWTDYNHKKLWSIRKDGSSKSPVILRTFRNPAMGVVVFRHQPLNCSLVSSEAHHHAYRGDGDNAETLATIFTTIAFLMVLVMAAYVFIRLKDRTRSLVSNKNEGTFAFQNFENCDDKVYAACERAIWWIQYSPYFNYFCHL